MSPRTPMVVVSGSLGSGKTTLLRHLLTADLGRVALIVNEFGELGIDGQVLEGEHYRLVELAGGGVCCSLSGEFAAAVAALVAEIGPELILVETTGVAEADALVLDIDEQLPQIRLETVVVVVDADACCRFPALGYAERSQIGVADLLLLNKTDLVDSAQCEQVVERLRLVNGRAALVQSHFGRLDPSLLAGPKGDWAPTPAAEAGHQLQLETFTWLGAGGFCRQRFEQAVAAWPAAVYRAKGFVQLDGQLCLFNYVAGRWQADPAAQGRPGLVFIGPDLASQRAAVVAGLEECRYAL